MTSRRVDTDMTSRGCEGGRLLTDTPPFRGVCQHVNTVQDWREEKAGKLTRPKAEMGGRITLINTPARGGNEAPSRGGQGAAKDRESLAPPHKPLNSQPFTSRTSSVLTWALTQGGEVDALAFSTRAVDIQAGGCSMSGSHPTPAIPSGGVHKHALPPSGGLLARGYFSEPDRRPPWPARRFFGVSEGKRIHE